MNILMLNFSIKGLGTYYRSYNWAKYLVRMGHKVTIACLSNEHRNTSKIYFDDGIRILETPNFLDGNWLMSRFSGIQGWGFLDIIIRLKEIFRTKYDIVHTFEHHPNVSIPVYLASKKKRPIFVSDWCDNYGKGGFRDLYRYRLDYLYRQVGFPLRRLMDFIERDLRKRSQGITVISEFLLKRAINMGIERNKIFLIRGSVDTNIIIPLEKEIARKKLGFAKQHKYLAFLGSYQLDLDLALQALTRLIQYEPNIYFLIIGKENNNIKKKASELSLTSNIIQTGWCSDQQLPWYLSVADAFLLPMKDNPVNQARWPNKICEYMAAGRPTICTRVGEVAKVIEEEKIGLVSEIDCEDFAKKIILILKDHKLSIKMGEKARNVAIKKFALNIQGSRLESIYKTLKKKYDLEVV